MNKALITGNQAVIKAALQAGADFFTGYPITPTTEVLEYWAKEQAADPKLTFLQTEDEMAAGFAMIGGVLAGRKAFTATAGPGNILMQDPMGMAENLRLPTVVIIMQRGGPSTGTVIYSQQELTLTCFGGNGEGLRIVYSPAGGQEIYNYTYKAFNVAWKYRFPTFLLGDGYQAKELSSVDLDTIKDLGEKIAPVPYLLNPAKKAGEYVNMRNTYNLEEELYDLVMDHKKAYDEMAKEVAEFEKLETEDAEVLIFAHGLVSSLVKEAIKELRSKNIKAGLFRPITLCPFPKDAAIEAVRGKSKILIAESSLGQFATLVKSSIAGVQESNIELIAKPAATVTKEEVVNKVLEMVK